MAKSKTLDYKPVLVKASAVPVLVAPVMLYLLASNDFSNALQSFYTMIAGVWVFSVVMAFFFPRRYRYTRLFSAAGAQLGQLNYIVGSYKDWSLRLISTVSWSNWAVALAVVGLIAGFVVDQSK